MNHRFEKAADLADTLCEMLQKATAESITESKDSRSIQQAKSCLDVLEQARNLSEEIKKITVGKGAHVHTTLKKSADVRPFDSRNGFIIRRGLSRGRDGGTWSHSISIEDFKKVADFIKTMAQPFKADALFTDLEKSRIPRYKGYIVLSALVWVKELLQGSDGYRQAPGKSLKTFDIDQILEKIPSSED
jgi:hypothetical protein